MTSQVELTPTTLMSLDQGYDDAGNSKWGPPPGNVGYIFTKRTTNAAPVAAMNGKGSFNQKLFDKFVEMRVGTGSPVYWYCIGELYSYPDGRLIAKVEGIDTARLFRESPARAVQLNRKIFIYRDAATGEVIRTNQGKTVQPIAYAYQVITYELKGDRLVTFVEQGSGAYVQKIGPGYGTFAREINGLTVFSAPLFLNIESPRGKYEAYENYDFWVPPMKSNAPYQLSWNRFGDLPPFFGTGKSIMQLVCYRIDTYAALPATMRDYLEKEAQLWMQPPANMAEIKELQKAK